MFYELKGKLYIGRNYPLYADEQTTEEVVHLRNGVEDLIVPLHHPDLVEFDMEFVNYNHQVPIRIDAKHLNDPNIPAMLDAYREQAAIITKHDCVPIPTFTDFAAGGLVDTNLTLDDAVGLWRGCIVETELDQDNGDLLINVYLTGFLFKNVIDPQDLITAENTNDMLVHKLLHVGPESSQQDENSPYYVFNIAIAAKYNLVEDNVVEGDFGASSDVEDAELVEE